MSKKSTLVIPLVIGTLCATEAQAAEAEAQPAPVLASAGVASDQDGAGSPAESEWEVAFTPYLWVAGTNADIAIPRGDGEVEVDKSFTDVLGNLKFAFMGTLDVRYRRFVMLGDVMYLSVGMKADGIRDAQFLEGHVDSSTFVSTIEGGYRLVDQGPLFLDVVAGARISRLHAKVRLEGPLQERERSKTVSQVAPIIGARVRVPIGPRTALGLYGDVGVSDADVKWQLFGSIQHDISKHWRLVGGYRYMSIRHDSESFDLDMSLSGPVLAATYTF